MGEEANIAEVPDIRGQVLGLLPRIPEGMVTTYGDLARAIGDERAARAVGKIMAENRNPDRFPCWRVVRSDGKVGKYSASGGREEKIKKLREDGIRVEDGEILQFSKKRFREFKAEKPLPELREKQHLVSQLASCNLKTPFPPEKIGGVDVSYEKDRAVGCYLEMDGDSGEVVRKEFINRRVKFPYIPSYLSFRELPILHRLLENARSGGGLADVILVDGNGILHPRGAGLATHLGVALDHPTVGIAKSLLIGEVDGGDLEEGESKPVFYKGNKMGCAAKTMSNANPVYVSVGHNVDLEFSLKVVFRASKFKLPEPVRKAHLSSRSPIESL